MEISVSNISPAAKEREKQSLIEFLALAAQYPMMLMDPTLIRTLAYSVDFRNEKAISKIQKIGLVMNLGLEQQINEVFGESSDSNGNALQQRQAAQATPNNQEQIQQQITNQSIQ